ncbi:hypothetical protein HK102_007389, partial [Quaeritorhiza haematococci]
MRHQPHFHGPAPASTSSTPAPSSQPHRLPDLSDYLAPPSLQSLPNYDPDLYAYLDNTPFQYRYSLPIRPEVQHEIQVKVEEKFCQGNEEYKSIVFGGGGGAAGGTAVGEPGEEEEPMSGVEDTDHTFEDEHLPPEYRSTQRGKACGHVFEKGEAVYRCRNCGLDDTCVFCSRCFYATEHEGHDTKFSIATGSGGCCDCGDPEAWKVPVQCKYHSPISNKSEGATGEMHSNENGGVGADDEESKTQRVPLPEPLINSMRTTIATVLDFITDVLASTPHPLSLRATPDEIRAANPPEGEEETLAESEGRMLYCCVLWNDEVHSFQEVIAQVVEAKRCASAEAKRVAERVDAH